MPYNFKKTSNYIHSIQAILILGSFFRLLAVLFSKGYGMHDDHFLVIEISQSWVENWDSGNWLPYFNAKIPQGHSLLYPGIHYILFYIIDFLGVQDPQIKMFIIRMLHASYSMIAVYYSYKITLELSQNKKTAGKVGLLMALFWIMPNMSVRNLVEMVSIPLLLIGSWYVILANKNNKTITFFWAGILLGFAFNIRFQTIVFTAGLGIVLLFYKRIKGVLFMSLGVLLAIVSIQGIVDFVIWGRPFAEFWEYFSYNMTHSGSYIVQPWFTYMLFLIGIMIPPISIFIMIGNFKVAKKHILLFVPIVLFIAFHSFYANKQERFILPVIPFLFILGIIGIEEIRKKRIWIEKMIKYSWVFFWIINVPLLFVISSTYTKKSRVEAMYYFYDKKDVKALLLEDSNKDANVMMPRFYASKKEIPIINFVKNSKKEQLKKSKIKPDYVLFFQRKNLHKRVENLKSIYPNIKYKTTIKPSFVDYILFKLNPYNKNEEIFIYQL